MVSVPNFLYLPRLIEVAELCCLHVASFVLVAALKILFQHRDGKRSADEEYFTNDLHSHQFQRHYATFLWKVLFYLT